MEKKHQFNLTYLLIAFGLLLLFQSFWVGYTQIENVPYSKFQELLKDKQIDKVVVSPSQIQGEFKAPQDGKKYFTTTPVNPEIASELAKIQCAIHRQHGRKFLPRYSVLGSADTVFRGALGLLYPAHGRAAGHGRYDERRPVARQDLCRDENRRQIRGRGGCGRGQGRAEGGRGLPEGPRALRPAWRARAQGHPARRPARHRQDAAGARGGGRGGRAVLLDLRLRVRGDVRGRRRRARPRSVRAGAQDEAVHHLYR